MADRVCVGAIAGAFGVRGDVRLKSFCAVAEDLASYGPLSTEDGTRRFDITLTGTVKGGLSARLSGVATKEQADALRGIRLYAPREALPSLPDDEFYYADLVGLQAFDTGGAPLGRVAAVLNHGAGDILELRGAPLKGSVLVPFTNAIVPTVDLAAGRLVIDPPEGLFET
ncbi:ribosome maturation factor RimM [Roseibacterium sp. SDUM158016]|jgi:16S rRNA processing protein RimM|uniref:ribosome maturation factor RimM n=1 Tax=Roseicyclus sediminis TaxID=2980997 RepID=UPI0021CE9D4C|nr:ribosome maturation factor RimM [Roseibacterium sp. SDUM158016]MCU4651301.1 ribosome maturation factor RimM [Roseibacterium sp. SDUM158016]